MKTREQIEEENVQLKSKLFELMYGNLTKETGMQLVASARIEVDGNAAKLETFLQENDIKINPVPSLNLVPIE